MLNLAEIFDRGKDYKDDTVAIIDPGGAEAVQYGELASRARKLGARLSDLGLDRGDVVALLLNKTPDSVVALLAVLSASMAYVPLDIASTPDRNGMILNDCRPPALFTGEGVDVDVLFGATLPCEFTEVWCTEPGLKLYLCDWGSVSKVKLHNDIALILYTSGSTGRPKGVQITHRNALSFVEWCLRELKLPPGGVCVSIAPFHFDLSVFDLFVSLYRGAQILLLDQKTCQNPLLIVKYLQQFRVNVCYSTPTLLRLLLRHGRMERADLHTLTHILFAGEVFPPAALAQLRSKLPGVRFYNLYGPTETNVVASYRLPRAIEPARDVPYPIGKPCDHATCRLMVGDTLCDIEAGLEGELLVAGPSVTPGYVGHMEADNHSFIAGPDGRLFYRTGDMVRVESDGDLSFLYRRDRMIKRRGYRIQLEEIERVLNAHAGLHEAAICAQSVGDEVRLLAYISPVSGSEYPRSRDLKRHCLEYLPQYFLPDEFVTLESLPKTSSGKIDYQALKGELS